MMPFSVIQSLQIPYPNFFRWYIPSHCRYQQDYLVFVPEIDVIFSKSENVRVLSKYERKGIEVTAIIHDKY